MKKKNKIKLNEKQKALIISIFYFIFVLLFSLLFHERWRDEAQAFLLARDLDIIGLFKQLSYEGHPPLWYLILMPFAKLGFPYAIESVISCLFMSIGHYLILAKSPFKDWAKVLILFIAPSVVFSLVSRSYCLVPISVYLIAINYNDRHKNKMKYAFCLLFTLYTHVLMLGLVAALFIQFGLEELHMIYKDKKELKSFIKVFLVSCLFVFSLFIILYGGREQNVLVGMNWYTRFNLGNIFTYLIEMIFISDIVIFILVTIFVLYTLYYGFKDNIKEILLLILGVGWIIFVYTNIYGPDFQKNFLILYIFIFYFWIKKKTKNTNKIISIMLVLLLLNNIVLSFSFLKNDYENNFSDAKDTANYIEKNMEDDSVFVASDIFITSSVIPYTNNKKFWNPASKKYYTYAVQDKYSIFNYSAKEVVDSILESFQTIDNVYIIHAPQGDSEHFTKDKIDTYIELEKEEVLIKIYEDKEKPMREDEYYIIYKINKDKVIK